MIISKVFDQESEFELVEELPAGKVFQCYHVKDMRKRGEDAVVRLLPEKFAADQSIVNRFHEFFARFNDIPNRRYVPSVYSVVGVAGKEVYVVEEYCSGVSLAQFVEKNRGSKTFIQDVTEVLARVCEGLHHAHQKTISHLCVLPSDILIDDHDYSKVKLVGFGAQIFASKGKVDCLSGENSRYVAPEVFKRGVFGPKADVYSLAVTIKELLPEFAQGSDILNRALSITLKDRFTSIREFAANIKELALINPVAEPHPKVVKTAQPKGGLNLVLMITSEPEGAEVLSNGAQVGTTNASGLMVPWKPGNLIEIKKPGYSTETLNFQAPPENTEIIVKLKSVMTIYTNPWGAAVKINGVEFGVTDRDGIVVPWQGSEIEIQKPGFKSESLKFVTVPLEQEKYIELETVASSVVPKRHWLELVGYGLGAIVLWLLPLAIYSTTVNYSGLDKQLGDRDREIARLTQVEKTLKIDFDKQVSDFRSRVKTKDAEIERLVQTEKNLKIDAERQVFGLRSELNNKASEIAKLTQTDLEKSRLLEELQKQLSDSRAQSNNRDAEIARLTQEKLAEQRLRKNFESQLSAANSELMKKGQEISRLKTAQSQAPAINPKTHIQLSSVSMELISAAGSGDDYRVKGLLAQGADPNARNDNGHTALMIASVNGHLGVVHSLLRAGADMNLESPLGWTVLDFAKQYNHPNIISLLSQRTRKASPQAPPAKQPVVTGNEALTKAAFNGDPYRVNQLLNSGADPNSRNDNGHTALMMASINGNTEVVKALLKYGADKNLRSRVGWTALDFAKQYNHTSLLPYLR